MRLRSQHHFYPFGCEHGGSWNQDTRNNHLYTGQERQGSFDLEYLRYKVRFGDPFVMGRFQSPDPLSEKFSHINPFNCSENSPIANIDLWGLQKFNVTARAFIPQKTLANPNKLSSIKSFAGDNRTVYNANASSYRVEQSVSLNFDNSSSSTLSNTVAPTVGLDKNGNPIATSEFGLGGTLSSSVSDGVGKVSFGIDAGNKISEKETFGATPNINMSGSLKLTPTDDGGFNFSLDVSADGFPAYEIFVTDEDGNSTLIFGRNPIESGEGPFSLFPPMEHDFEINGSSSTSPQGPVIKFDDQKNPK